MPPNPALHLPAAELRDSRVQRLTGRRDKLSWVVRPRKNFEVTMVQTYGLTHINLAVRDLGRALRFYEQVFGLREYGRGEGLVHTQASGRHDIVTFAEDPANAGLSGGVAHFGFRLVDPDDIDRAIAEVERAGGRMECVKPATAQQWGVINTEDQK